MYVVEVWLTALLNNLCGCEIYLTGTHETLTEASDHPEIYSILYYSLVGYIGDLFGHY